VVARIAYVEVVGRSLKLGFDALGYEILGRELANGLGYSNPGTVLLRYHHPSANFPPGYPFFIALLNKLGTASSVDIQLAGAFLGVITIVATGFLGLRITGRAGVGLLGAALVALSPTLIASAGSSMAESLSVPLMVLVLLAASWAVSTSRLLPWVVVGLAAGLLALVRSEDLLVALVLVPLAALLTPACSWRRRCVAGALAVAVALAVVSPWFVRNYTTFQPHVLTTTAADKTLAGANCATTYSGSLIGYWDFSCIGHDRLATSNEALYGKLASDEGLHFLRTHLPRLPLVASVRILRAWGVYRPIQESQLDALETRSATWQKWAWPVSLGLLALSLPGFVLLRRNHVGLLLIAGPAVLDTLIVVATYGNDRFVLSAVPSLCIAAALNVMVVAGWIRGRSKGSGAVHDAEEGWIVGNRVSCATSTQHERARDSDLS
jgi:4-amino-4-deoxy-L-arabinose transferase-like glycosyltransferase